MKISQRNGLRLLIIIILSFFSAAVIVGCGGDDSTTITPDTAVKESWLFVQTAPSGTLTSNAAAQTSGSMAASEAAEYTLTLLDVDSDMIGFSARPNRDVVNLTVSDFVAQWNDLGFVDDPPYAALELMEPQGDVDVTIVELFHWYYDGSSLSYTVRPLSGDQSFLESHEGRADSIAEIPTDFDDVTLFIDTSSSAVDDGDDCYTGVPKTGQTTSWAIGDDGEYQLGESLAVSPSAGPSFGNYNRLSLCSSTGFTDNGDGTVTDNVTGLIWLKDARCIDLAGTDSDGQGDWTTALSASNLLADGTCGLSDGSSAGDWRLPNINELRSLFDPNLDSPYLPDGHPFTGVEPYIYWSSSTYAGNTYGAWYVHVRNGYVDGYSKSDPSYVWPVRSGN